MQLHLLRVRVWALPVAERFRLIIQDHRSIYKAYLERDLDLVVARMESHLRRTKETCAAIGKNPSCALDGQPCKGGSLGEKGEVYLVLEFS